MELELLMAMDRRKRVKQEIAAGEREVDANERCLIKFLTELTILGFGLLAV